MKAITVADLIQILGEYPQDLKVAYCICSEQCLLDEGSLTIQELCHPREDGWVQDKRPDMETEKYLVFPGN
jgi:hypothetical protein